MALDTACGDLSNLKWDEIDPVEVPVDNTFSPHIDFLRGDPTKGGIGAAIQDSPKLHFRVAAVNKNGQSNYSDFKRAHNPVQLGTLDFPAQIFPNQPTNSVNISTCEDIKNKRPICSNITTAITVFKEIVNMEYKLAPNLQIHDFFMYNWTDISFGREGTKIRGNTSEATDTVIDCNGGRCFAFCKTPLYTKTTTSRCFPPSELRYLTFRNGRVKNSNGGVLNVVPAVNILQRRPLVLEHLIFENNIAYNGSGGAIAVSNCKESAAVKISNVVFHRNKVYAGSGGAMAIDSSLVDFTQVEFVNNCAFRQFDESDRANTSNLTTLLNFLIDAANTTISTNTTTSEGSAGEAGEESPKTVVPTDELLPIPHVAVNTSGNGGAISACATESGSVVTLTQSTINGNIAKNSGGGIFILGSKLYINQNTRAKEVPKVEAYNNSAVLGGNIYLESSTLIATRTTTSTEKHFEVRNGRAHEFGGGLACVGSTVEMDDVLVVDNKAILDGGGIYGVLCLFKAQSTSIVRNNAGGNGGGLFFQSISNVALENVLITQNLAGAAGGD